MLALVVYIWRHKDGDTVVRNVIHRFERRQPSVKEIRDLEYDLNTDHSRCTITIVNIIELYEKRDCFI